jgi:hypothetical protein
LRKEEKRKERRKKSEERKGICSMANEKQCTMPF